MLEIKYMTAFKREVKKIKDKKALSALKDILTLLIDEKQLPASCNPHPLHGEYSGYMDCHVKSDLILIYRIEENTLWLYRIGSHSYLFK